MTGGAAKVILYVREGCHLCDDFLVGLSLEMGPAYGDLAVVDVDRDPGLAARYGLRVPQDGDQLSEERSAVQESSAR